MNKVMALLLTLLFSFSVFAQTENSSCPTQDTDPCACLRDDPAHVDVGSDGEEAEAEDGEEAGGVRR